MWQQPFWPSWGAEPLLANGIGFACAFPVSYLGHYYWTFTSGTGHATGVARFAALALASLIWSSFVVHVGSLFDLAFLLSLAVILISVPPINFTLSKLWVFNVNAARPMDLDLPLLGILLMGATWFYSGTVLNHDTSWYLIATSRWLDGAVLYRDIMEINPPLAFYLTAPAILLSRMLEMPAMGAFVITTMIGIGGTLFWTRRLLVRSAIITRQRRYLLLAAGFIALCITPVGDFGQRDHLMVAFALPYVVLVAFSANIAARERALVGIVAGIGLCLKPHFLILPFLLGLLTIWRQRRILAPFTPENLAIAGGSVLYVLSILVFYPAYFAEVIPAGQLIYYAYGRPALQVLLIAASLAIPALAVLGWRLPNGPEKKASNTLGVVVLAFTLAYVIQFKG